MGDTPERERSVPMESVEEVKRKSKEKENRSRGYALGYEKEDKNCDEAQVLSGYQGRKGVKS